MDLYLLLAAATSSSSPRIAIVRLCRRRSPCLIAVMLLENTVMDCRTHKLSSSTKGRSWRKRADASLSRDLSRLAMTRPGRPHVGQSGKAKSA